MVAIVLVLNGLRTTPFGELRYSFTTFDHGTRRRLVVNFTLWPLPPEERDTCTHWLGY
jgi:hypothetical protein